MRATHAFRIAAACSALAGVLALSGCGATYSRTDVSQSSSAGAQLRGSVSTTRIVVPVGGLVMAHIAPFNSDNNPMVGTVLSQDTAVLDVEPSVGDKDYAFMGVHVGSTRVSLLADGAIVSVVAVDVVEQSAAR